MPTSTFFHLPEAKRIRLLRAAVLEFARKPYGEVSLNRIIQEAEIPRGSFYQYFSDKTELFRYIMLQFAQRLEGVILTVLDNCANNLLELPLSLFDYIVQYLQNNGGDVQIILSIIRQNMEFNVGQIPDFQQMEGVLLEQIDSSNLSVNSREELSALTRLLLLITGQYLISSVAKGKYSVEEAREHLNCTVLLIRRGVELS